MSKAKDRPRKNKKIKKDKKSKKVSELKSSYDSSGFYKEFKLKAAS